MDTNSFTLIATFQANSILMLDMLIREDLSELHFIQRKVWMNQSKERQ